MSTGPDHFEIGVPDAARFKAFFGPLLGWRFHTMGSGEEGWIETGGVRGGLHETSTGAGIVTYFAVPDLDVALDTVRELGGEASTPSAEEPGFGRFAECRDDQGLAFGLHQTAASS